MVDVAVTVGGVVVRLTGLPAALAAVARRRYGAFLAPPAQPAAVTIAVTIDDAGAAAGPAAGPDAGPDAGPGATVDETLTAARTCAVERRGDAVVVRGPGFAGRLDPATRRGVLRAPLALGPLDAMLRAALTLGLLEGDGVLVHAAGVARAGRALVFAGPSGAGKSTLGQALAAAPDTTLLADELVVLRLTAAGVVAAGTPFWSGTASAGALGGLFLLERGGPPGVHDLSAGQGVPALWRELGRYLPVAALERRAFALLGEIVRRVPLRRLTLPEDLAGVQAHATALLSAAGHWG